MSIILCVNRAKCATFPFSCLGCRKSMNGGENFHFSRDRLLSGAIRNFSIFPWTHNNNKILYPDSYSVSHHCGEDTISSESQRPSAEYQRERQSHFQKLLKNLYQLSGQHKNTRYINGALEQEVPSLRTSSSYSYIHSSLAWESSSKTCGHKLSNIHKRTFSVANYYSHVGGELANTSYH